MDKMRSFIRFLRKQHFWLVVPVLLMLMLAAWFSASSAAIDDFKAGSDNINQKFQDMSNVSGIAPHPNEQFNSGMEQLIRQRAKDVAAAWDIRYKNQVGTMKWSEKLAKQWPDLVAEVDPMRPIESVSQEATILPWMLETYRDFIVNEELTRLADIIGSRWKVAEADLNPIGGPGGGYGATSGDEAAGGAGGYGGYGGYSSGGYGGYGGGEDWDDSSDGVNPIVVYWNPENQQRIQATSFGWSLRGTGSPTLLEMLYSQEDVWVLDSLMQIIKATNGDANHRSQAVIKEIESIDIGRLVGKPRGKVSKVQSESEEEDDGFGSLGGTSSDGYDSYASDYASGIVPEDDEFEGGAAPIDVADGRYVDANYESIDGETLRSSSESTDLKSVAVAKRMPVRMQVKMDTRRIPKLLAACANAPLTFEVHQLRLNPGVAGAEGAGPLGGGYEAVGGYGGAAGGYGGYGAAGGDSVGYDPAPGAGGGYGGYGGYGGSGGDGYGGYGGYGAAGGYGGGYDDGYGEEAGMTESFDKVVELFGLIYIYNPVDRAKLELDEDAEAGEVPTEGDVAQVTR